MVEGASQAHPWKEEADSCGIELTLADTVFLIALPCYIPAMSLKRQVAAPSPVYAAVCVNLLSSLVLADGVFLDVLGYVGEYGLRHTTNVTEGL